MCCCVGLLVSLHCPSSAPYVYIEFSSCSDRKHCDSLLQLVHMCMLLLHFTCIASILFCLFDRLSVQSFVKYCEINPITKEGHMSATLSNIQTGCGLPRPQPTEYLHKKLFRESDNSGDPDKSSILAARLSPELGPHHFEGAAHVHTQNNRQL